MAVESPNAKLPVRWADLCRSLRVMGYMKNFTKAECFRVAKQLQKRVDDGKAVRLKRGLYDIARPAKRRTARSSAK